MRLFLIWSFVLVTIKTAGLPNERHLLSVAGKSLGADLLAALLRNALSLTHTRQEGMKLGLVGTDG